MPPATKDGNRGVIGAYATLALSRCLARDHERGDDAGLQLCTLELSGQACRPARANPCQVCEHSVRDAANRTAVMGGSAARLPTTKPPEEGSADPERLLRR